MNFDAVRYVWLIVNALIMIVVIGLAFIVPVWVYRKVNSIEGNLKELNHKLDKLIQNDNRSEK